VKAGRQDVGQKALDEAVGAERDGLLAASAEGDAAVVESEEAVVG
jgi:hypothetical protein